MRTRRGAELPAAVAAILDQLATPVVLVDERGQAAFVNDAATQLHSGWRDNDLPSALVSLVGRVRASNAPVTAHAVALFGDRRRFDVAVSPLAEPKKWTLVEIALLHADWETGEVLLHQHSAASTLMRGLSHELRNPLAGVRGAAQLMARTEDAAERVEYRRIIERECERMTRLLSAMTGSQPLQRSTLNIHQVAEQVLALIAGEAGEEVALVRDYDPSLPSVAGDRDALMQALLNLARNALQAGAKSITLRTRLARDALVGATRHPRVVRVDVIDDGPGVPENLRPMLFFPTVSGRAGGSGMGLTIAQSIAIRHDGLLSFESEPGWTVFMLHLPLNNQRP